MTILTIRIEQELKKKAAKQAEELGIPLTLVVKNALNNFIKSSKFTIGEPEIMMVSPNIQRKMDKIGQILSKK